MSAQLLECLVEPAPAEPGALRSYDFAGTTWLVRRPAPFVLVIEGPADAPFCTSSPGVAGDYLHDVLLAPEWRESFLRLVDETGMVSCRNVGTPDARYRDVRGRSSRGKLSPGEYYHHDGCSGPVKPRVVEIRCPYQDYTREVATAVAPFLAVVPAMLQAMPRAMAQRELPAEVQGRLTRGEITDPTELDGLQGIMTRAIRRSLGTEDARACLREVDRLAGAYFAPWQQGESRLIANANDGTTLQHRRAYQEVHRGGQATGHLLKRWTSEEYLGPGQTVDPSTLPFECEDDDVCARGRSPAA